ncbi:MFS transporter [Pseudomonas bohemica]|uniref:MFS transporter n=1 Tax=Pseudomonas bohemica TaxID=2044872 RepID=UPI0018FF1126|nr:MFS transporter [Pseudomonas bohemica]
MTTCSSRVSTVDLCDLYWDSIGPNIQQAFQGLVSLGGKRTCAGPAMTVTCVDDNVLIRELVSSPGNGQVLVIDGGTSANRALLGDVQTAKAMNNGWAGLVINGYVRDRELLSFMALRFLLGVAEAGFFPGMVLYISYWFPQEYRGRLTALFMTAIPLSALIGAPLSGFLLESANFLSIASWKWMFIIEGVPAIVLGVVVLIYLTDRPSEAKWLTPEEKDWLIFKLSVEKTGGHLSSFKDAFKSLDVMLMGVIHLGFAVGSYGIAIWLPQILKAHRLSSFHIGLMSMIPYGVAIVGMIAWGALSDKSPNRSLHVAASCMLGATGLLIAAAVPTLFGAIVGISISTLGVIAARPIFWTLPGSFLTGSAAAGIAFINAFGNLGGFIGPYVIGLIKDQTGSFTLGIVATSLPLALSVVAALVPAKRLAPLRADAATNTSESVQEPI